MAAQTYIGGVEVTDAVLEGSATRRLNRPAQASVKVPITSAIGDVGDRLKVVFDGSLFFHGTILMIEDEADEDFGYTVYNATDPMELWQWRPCRDIDGPTPGNLIDPSFLSRNQSGPQIINEILRASENPDFDPIDTWQALGEGPLFVELGSFEGGGQNLEGAPVTWPMTIAEMVNLLTSTGEVDVILTPIDSGGNMARVDVYNGDYGTDLSGSVSYDYGTGNYNVRRIRQSVDMTTMVNKLVYEIGPKQTVRRYRGNITGDNPTNCFLDSDDWTHSYIIGVRDASRGTYGVRMEIQEWDTELWVNENPPTDCNDPNRILLRRLWQLETWIRAQPRQLVHVTPIRGTGVGDFDIGDLVGVSAGGFFRGGFSGAQRVYEYTVSWDTDGVYELSELQTSAVQN